MDKLYSLDAKEERWFRKWEGKRIEHRGRKEHDCPRTAGEGQRPECLRRFGKVQPGSGALVSFVLNKEV